MLLYQLNQKIKYGVFLLIKLSKFIKNTAFIAAGVFLLFLIGCKSAPLAVQVNPLDLLDDNSSFYMAIPQSVDPELIKRVVQNNVKGISEGNAALLANQVRKVYCGLNRYKNRTEIQATIDANIPQKYVSKVLNKKNGFTAVPLQTPTSPAVYTLYSSSQLDLAFPSSKVGCLGRDTKDMLCAYDKIFTTAEPDYDGKQYSPLDTELYDYLMEDANEIRFYANKPQSFLTILTGANLDLKLVDVKGAFVCDPVHDDQYLLNIHFNFKNEKYLKAGRVLLVLAFGLTDSQSWVEGTDQLFINGIKIHKEQLYKLLAI